MIAYAAIAIVQSIAVYKIRKFSKMLVANQVFVNERLMIFHLFAFIWLSLCKIIVLALGMVIDDESILLTDAPL